jgi:hypothetical protein
MSGSELADAIAQAQAAAAAPPVPAPAMTDDYGRPIGPPPGPTPAQELDNAVQIALRQTALQGADTRTGAPVEVRAVVGASPQADRLANLQRYYPDATPVPGTSNFVYTDPQGRRQTYAPMGWRIPTAGDVASVGPEIAEGVGGLGGAALGSLVGPVGTAAGSGLGAAAGNEGYRGLMRFLGMEDTRTPLQVGTDVALTAGVNAVAPVVGQRVIGPALSELIRGTPTETALATRALEQSGLAPGLSSKLPAGVIGESPGIQRTEQVVGMMPATGGVRPGYQAADTALDNAAQAAAARAAGGQPVPTPATFADNVNGIAKRIDERWNTSRELADDNAQTLVGPDRPVDLQAVIDLRNKLSGQLGQASGSLAGRFGGALDRIDQITADAGRSSTPATATGTGTLPYSVVRNIRTDLGKEIDWQQTAPASATPPTGVPAQQLLYGALNDSLTGAADQAGPLARSALDAHNAMVASYKAAGGPAETFAELADPAKQASAITRLAQSTAPEDQVSLAHLMSPQFSNVADRGTIRAGVLQQMGTKSDQTFDMPTWLRAYDRMPQPQKDLLFGYQGAPGSLQGDLGNLATVQRQMGSSAGYRNFPNTAPTIAMLNGIAALTTGVLSGDVGKAAMVGASTFGGPWAAGKLLTSQPFVKWMAGTYGVNPASAAQWGSHLGRLAGVAEADPGIAHLVTQLRAQLPTAGPAAAQ